MNVLYVAGESYMVFTRADAGYVYTMTTMQHVFRFAIKTGSDAHIKLIQFPGQIQGQYVEVKQLCPFISD